MHGGAQVRWCEVVPSPEAGELLRLALVVGQAAEVDLNDFGARRQLQQLFAALESVEHAGRRLRDVVLEQLLTALADRPGAFGDAQDLAQLAGVSPSHLTRLIARLGGPHAADGGEPAADD